MRQRNALLAQLADGAQTVQTGHMDVKKDQVRLQFLNQVDGFQAVPPGGGNLNIRKIF